MKTFFEFFGHLMEENPPQQQPQMQQPQAQQAPQQQPQQAQNQQPQQPQQAQQAQNAGAADPVARQKLVYMLQASYPDFVKALGDNIKDPKFLALIESGLADGNPADDVVKFTKIQAKVSDLKPTQFEIDIDKSLAYPLQKESVEKIRAYIQGGNFKVGRPIITGGNGKFIIDGHHRWSQVYCMNPNTTMDAIDMEIADSTYALKVTQLAIAAKLKRIPTNKVEGVNLLNIGEEAFKSWVTQNIGQNAVQVFTEMMQKEQSNESNYEFMLRYFKRLQEQDEAPTDYDPRGATKIDDKGKVVDAATGGGPKNKYFKGQNYFTDQAPVQYAGNFVWKNVQLMQQNNQPLDPKAPRGIMPQTDDAAGWNDALSKGEINIKPESMLLAGLLTTEQYEHLRKR